jgi:hypothetical protein
MVPRSSPDRDGMITMQAGPFPTAIGVSAVLVAMLIRLTVPGSEVGCDPAVLT